MLGDAESGADLRTACYRLSFLLSSYGMTSHMLLLTVLQIILTTSSMGTWVQMKLVLSVQAILSQYMYLFFNICLAKLL